MSLFKQKVGYDKCINVQELSCNEDILVLKIFLIENLTLIYGALLRFLLHLIV